MKRFEQITTTLATIDHKGIELWDSSRYSCLFTKYLSFLWLSHRVQPLVIKRLFLQQMLSDDIRQKLQHIVRGTVIKTAQDFIKEQQAERLKEYAIVKQFINTSASNLLEVD